MREVSLVPARYDHRLRRVRCCPPTCRGEVALLSPSSSSDDHARIFDHDAVRDLVDRGRESGRVSADDVREACETAALPMKESRFVVEYLKSCEITVEVDAGRWRGRRHVGAASARRTSAPTGRGWERPA